jgi:hypothetical protein
MRFLIAMDVLVRCLDDRCKSANADVDISVDLARMRIPDVSPIV